MTTTRRRTGRPSKDALGWINLPAAHSRLAEIGRTIQELEAERSMLRQILGRASVPSAAAPRARGRRPQGGGPSMLDAISQVIAGGSASKGWRVGELRDALAKIYPDKVSAPNASALISSALVQSLKAKQPRFTGSKAGPGRPRKYKLAQPTPVAGSR